MLQKKQKKKVGKTRKQAKFSIIQNGLREQEYREDSFTSSDNMSTRATSYTRIILAGGRRNL